MVGFFSLTRSVVVEFVLLLLFSGQLFCLPVFDSVSGFAFDTSQKVGVVWEACDAAAQMPLSNTTLAARSLAAARDLMLDATTMLAQQLGDAAGLAPAMEGLSPEKSGDDDEDDDDDDYEDDDDFGDDTWDFSPEEKRIATSVCDATAAARAAVEMLADALASRENITIAEDQAAAGSLQQLAASATTLAEKVDSAVCACEPAQDRDTIRASLAETASLLESMRAAAGTLPAAFGVTVTAKLSDAVRVAQAALSLLS